MKPSPTAEVHAQLKAWWEKDASMEKREATRKGFGKGLLEAAKEDKDVTALTANLGSSTALGAMRKRYPARSYDVGVAEQTLAGIAAGMASEGLKPVMTSFAVFSPGRNWDFIRTQIALNKHPVAIVGSHAGLATGEDGATHQALEDVALMRSLPGMTIISPGDAEEAAEATKELLNVSRPSYLRLTRAATPLLLKHRRFRIGKARTIIKGSDIAIMSSGTTLEEAVKAARELWEKHKISASVTHHATIKPLDAKAIDEAAARKLIVTIEDHNTTGGLGSAVAERLAEKPGKARLLRLGVQDEFGQSGTKEELYKHYGLDGHSIASKTMAALKKRS